MEKGQSLTENLGFVVAFYAQALARMKPAKTTLQDPSDLIGSQEILHHFR
ncbi:hypothetical protein K9U39_14650 [Rhodoblastus acidophilus]|uniref:Uncharacterized protein n=1 Tax=Candidatus Rhodoblastus alkanivorans TaxID=2954117 RepID=A0ABS9ZB87_9HYPH|nr:hypothetical protein [Candidatus Rhodoblastus alkanivorans]MCI4679368.1 hypothetical protein [Candidatus Rhodoblastus alkanivorans]MCI4684844.1 hypothetical protein [Candidatus Rhodoblastus alkanivorans]MDI4642168.1 hypothetical protein [Rhodoblastus acidophilus]